MAILLILKLDPEVVVRSSAIFSVHFVIKKGNKERGSFNQSESRKQFSLASDWLKFETLPRKYRPLYENKKQTKTSPQIFTLQVVGELLRGGANVNMSGIVGDRPLHLACSRGHVNIVKRLLSTKDCEGKLEVFFSVNSSSCDRFFQLMHHFDCGVLFTKFLLASLLATFFEIRSFSISNIPISSHTHTLLAERRYV